MKLSSALHTALNNQVTAELTASYHYLGMSAYFEKQGLPGFANWFRGQSAEETEHGMKIFDFIHRRDADVTLGNISAGKQSFQSVEDVISTALKMEQAVTAQIHDIHTIAVKDGDAAAQNLMNWFAEEQVEEEDSMRNLLERVSAADDDRWRLLVLDGQLPKRGADAE